MVDPYNSIPSTPSVQSDKDSASAEDAKSAERRADVARTFRGTLAGSNAASAGALGGAGSSAGSPRQGASSAKSPLGAKSEQTFLSPAMMKLQQQGYPIPTGVPEKKVMPQYERGGGGGADSGGSLGGEGGRGESKEVRSRSSQGGGVKRSSDAAMDRTRQVTAA